MVKHIQGKDGKFAGSIGDGKTRVPSASDVPVNPYKLPSDVDDYGVSLNHVYEVMRESWCRDILADPTAAVARVMAEYEAGKNNGDWVVEESDPGEIPHVKIARKIDRTASILWQSGALKDVGFVSMESGYVDINVDEDGLPQDTRFVAAVTFVAVPFGKYSGGWREEYQTSHRYYQHGVLHRVGGAACEDSDGSQVWVENGKRLASVDAQGRILDGHGNEVTGFLLKRRFKKRFPGMRDAVKYAPNKLN